MSSRSFRVNGEVLVSVKGADGTYIETLSELGLTSDSVSIRLNLYHEDIHVDDFGNKVPVEKLWMGAEAEISMTLIHYDQTILAECVRQSMAGGTEVWGQLAAIGTPVGRYSNLFDEYCHWISLNLSSPIEELPWRFPAAILTGNPFVLPIGTKASLLQLTWRAIPYRLPTNLTIGEVVSKEATLWSHTLD